MRKFIFTFIFLSFSTAYSQFFGGTGICFDCYTSMEIGVVSSSISGLDRSSPKTGFYIGFYQYNDISDSFAFRVGISYNTLGAKMKDEELFERSQFSIHAVGVPLSLHYTYKRRFQGFFGGEISSNVAGKLPKIKGEPDDWYGEDDPMFDFRDNVNFFDASIFFGTGIILIENIDISLKYNIAVSKLSKNEIDNWKKNWLTLSVAYTFRDY